MFSQILEKHFLSNDDPATKQIISMRNLPDKLIYFTCEGTVDMKSLERLAGSVTD